MIRGIIHCTLLTILSFFQGMFDSIYHTTLKHFDAAILPLSKCDFSPVHMHSFAYISELAQFA